MGMNMGKSTSMEMRQVIAPLVRNRIGASYDQKPYRISPRVVEAVGGYASDVSDSNILCDLRNSGIEADLRDIRFARALL